MRTRIVTTFGTPRGRSVVWNARLATLEALDEGAREFPRLFESLVARVNDYSGKPLRSSQRVFLMTRLTSPLAPDETFATLDAERLSLEYLEHVEHLDGTLPAGVLSPRVGSRVWQLKSSDGSIVALLEEENLFGPLQAIVSERHPRGGATARVLAPGSDQNDAAFLTVPLGDPFPGASLALFLQGDLFDRTARHQEVVYLWTGLVAVAGILTFATLLARYLQRQLRLTRLKNDLVASVSHELKTPLASMRLLVDTLLAGRMRDETQVREYLLLIAKENIRLSRLIDNFLSFSRMERNKNAFSFEEVRVADIVSGAVKAAGGRFDTPTCRLIVEVDEKIPDIHADREALVTVLLNLLDNGWKYGGEEKLIRLRADTDTVSFRVEDNGVELSRRASARVFDRFYQVDGSLSSSVGGFGLGLSIVKFIVDGHGGTVDVSSMPGHGSTFTVEIPTRSRAR